jgi:CsoR family transcriptional regulator, copper-sensing transcriptional repressor
MVNDIKNDIILRLRKVEGQTRGLQKMIEESKDCAEVINQLCAARKALDKVGFIILTHRMQECMNKKKDGDFDLEKAMEETMKLFLTLA